jgi:hypothetical protein
VVILEIGSYFFPGWPGPWSPYFMLPIIFGITDTCNHLAFLFLDGGWVSLVFLWVELEPQFSWSQSSTYLRCLARFNLFLKPDFLTLCMIFQLFQNLCLQLLKSHKFWKSHGSWLFCISYISILQLVEWGIFYGFMVWDTFYWVDFLLVFSPWYDSERRTQSTIKNKPPK